MKRYNIVLSPPENLSQKLTEHAQRLLGDRHNGYCLEQGKVFPHITLTQLKSADENLPQEIFDVLENYPAKFESALKFKGLYMTTRHSPDHPQLWVGLEIINANELQQLHESLANDMSDLNVEITNPTHKNYWPHLTLGRIHQDTEIENLKLGPAFWDASGFDGWRLVFGHSDDNGQLLSLSV